MTRPETTSDAPVAGRFSWIARGIASGPDPLFDVPVEQSASFLVIPSVGSIVPGWLLIVPRRSAINMSLLGGDERRELKELRGVVSARLRAAFHLPVFEFEHGPVAQQSPLGCGVDQAHLHMVPLPFNLIEELKARVQLTPTGTARDPWAGLDGGEYILAREAADSQSWVSHPRQPKSQFVRTVIAEAMAEPNRWDYREHKFPEHAAETRARLAA